MKYDKQNLINLSAELSPVLHRLSDLAKDFDEKQCRTLISYFGSFIAFIKNNNDCSIYDGCALGLIARYLHFKTAEYIVDMSQESLNKLNQYKIKTNHSSLQEFYDKHQMRINAFMEENEIEELKNILYKISKIILKVDDVTGKETQSAFNAISALFDDAEHENQATEARGYSAPTEAQTKETIPENKKQTVKLDTESVLAELNGLVGMENIKNDIQSLLKIIKYNKQRKEVGLPEVKQSLHSVFIGRPGTGKTTIARLLANLFYSLEILPQNNIIEVDRSMLVGGYIGQTAIKTSKVIDQALNGVLFIDEAYSLKRSSSDMDFGQEAIDILIKRMEDNRENLIVIVAGYETEMMRFIDSNPGLKSRFNRYFHFIDYTPSELTEIYKRMAEKQNYIIKPDAIIRVHELFEVLYNQRDERFGNARLARNIFDKTWEKNANRIENENLITKEALSTIVVEDIPFAEFTNNGKQ